MASLEFRSTNSGACENKSDYLMLRYHLSDHGEADSSVKQVHVVTCNLMRSDEYVVSGVSTCPNPEACGATFKLISLGLFTCAQKRPGLQVVVTYWYSTSGYRRPPQIHKLVKTEGCRCWGPCVPPQLGSCLTFLH